MYWRSSDWYDRKRESLYRPVSSTGNFRSPRTLAPRPGRRSSPAPSRCLQCGECGFAFHPGPNCKVCAQWCNSAIRFDHISNYERISFVSDPCMNCSKTREEFSLDLRMVNGH